MSLSSVQTNVSRNASSGVAGDEADGSTKDKVTRICASGALKPGTACFYTAKTCYPLTASNFDDDVPMGIVLLDRGRPSGQDYAIGDTVSIGVEGRFFVFAEETLAETDFPFVRHTASGANTVAGAFRNDGDTDKATGFAEGRIVQPGGVSDPPIVEIG